ncbi:MAG TPA: urease accessory protein UreD [Hyphomicrobiaceae bacterium]|nr:urease accessory protein UreD [Hyphomicrobiaceae bacterium]
MFAIASPSDRPAVSQPECDPLAGIRARGVVRLSTFGDASGTRIASLEESGGYRCKFPTTAAPWLQAAIVNTGGGVAGGDHIALSVTATATAHLRIGTATAERIYRSLGATTRVEAHIRAIDAATLVWAPQPTIIFSGSRLDRRYDIELDRTATVLVAEALCFGRRDNGELMGQGALRDRWYIRRDGDLVHAELTKLEGDIGAILDRRATLAGAHIAATLIFASPDAEDHVDGVRDLLAEGGSLSAAGVRAGLLIVRSVGTRLEHVERTLSRISAYLLSRRPFTTQTIETAAS